MQGLNKESPEPTCSDMLNRQLTQKLKSMDEGKFKLISSKRNKSFVIKIQIVSLLCLLSKLTVLQFLYYSYCEMFEGWKNTLSFII